MAFHFDYLTENTCSKVISMDIEGDVIKNIEFLGGCNGNLKTIPLLLDGWTADQIASKDPDYRSPLEEDEDE